MSKDNEKDLTDEKTEKNKVEEKNDQSDDSENYQVKYLKALAEMENMRKRLDQEKTDLYKYRAASFMQDILPTLDMFEMAIANKNISDEVKNWLVGFEMILKNFKASLEAEGIKEIKIKEGEEFNSEFHHAIHELESDEHEEGKIVQVKNKGYLIHDRLLRPAAVVVAKKKEDIKKEEKGEENE